MEIQNLIECRMVPRATCPRCGEKIEINQWSIVCGFKTEPDPKKTPIDGDHLSLVGVRIVGVCKKCTKANNDISGNEEQIGIYHHLTLSEFEEFVADHVVKFILDFNQGSVNLRDRDLSPKNFQ
jgi:hypothetical protein